LATEADHVFGDDESSIEVIHRYKIERGSLGEFGYVAIKQNNGNSGLAQ